MAGLTRSIIRQCPTRAYEVGIIGVNAGSKIFGGSFICREAGTNLAVPGADTAGLIPLGVSEEELDNTNGTDGVVAHLQSARTVRYAKTNDFAFDVSAGTPRPGNIAYLVDDNTVNANPTTNLIVAGRFVAPAPGQGTGTRWLVDIKNAALIQELVQVETDEALVAGVAAGYKIARGTTTPTQQGEVVATGLSTVVAVVVSLKGDPTLTHMWSTGDVGDQAGSPAAGSFTLNSWKPTATGDVTPIAATTPWSAVDWIAIGT